MKPYVIAIILTLWSSVSIFSQEVSIGSADINGTPQLAIIAFYNMPVDIVEGAWLKKITDAKFSKPIISKEGFKVYKAIQMNDIANSTMDYYIKIDDKKPNANFTMLISKGYDNFLKQESSDMTTIDHAKSFLVKFMTDINAYQLNLQTIAQTDVIKGIEKRLKNATEEEEFLTKSKNKTESKISGNEIEIQALKVDMEAQQDALAKVKSETATVKQMAALKKRITKQENKTNKVTKKYEKALEQAGTYKEDLQKTENMLNDNATEQLKIKAELEKANNQLSDLKAQLSNLK